MNRRVDMRQREKDEAGLRKGIQREREPIKIVVTRAGSDLEK